MSGNGRGNPFQQGLTREQVLAIARQQAPRPQEIRLEEMKPLVCDCGNDQMETVTVSCQWMYHPLLPQASGLVTKTQNRCSKCKKWPKFANGEWTFVVEQPPLE